MLNKIKKKLKYIEYMQRINIALSRAAATKPQFVDETDPSSWEFSGFSQNGEDGIIDHLVNKILDSNRYFIEIGSSNGIENNSAWLAVARKFSGIMIEGNSDLSYASKDLLSRYNLGVECLNLFVDQENIKSLKTESLTLEPDFFSLDIDGNDFYLMNIIIESGFRPKVISVEYNSVYGPERALTIDYDPEFRIDMKTDQYLYYGVSIGAWRNYFEKLGYKFITVDENGVNAFFVDPKAFDASFIDKIEGISFRENFYQYRKYKQKWEKQFEIIAHRNYMEVE